MQWSAVLFPAVFALASCDGSPEETGEPGPPQPANLVEPSGECPDLSASGLTTLTSSGEERRFSVRIPEEPVEDAPVVFFFHGFSTPDQTPEITEYFAESLHMQEMADATGAIFVVPESRIYEMYGLTFFMWDVWEEDEADLVLYDDLRTCVARAHPVDLRQLHVMGFSGGALFVTTVLRERGDTLASALEMSGGSDIELSMFENDLSRYATPASRVPTLLVSGGENDEWPQGMAMINFEEATDSLQDNLRGDDLYTVRCRHQSGHAITTPCMQLTLDWPYGHRYGEASPFEAEGIEVLGEDWCEVVP